ncbi:hypothetical protein LAZ67_8000083 [Cordylochernes scorpioides]|uniref:diacylglycerol O-acyltransferase n=1 Tax=Cordylochernes scorpioides TaxID=51811 RepID=A0ABY6KP21_9ARAC|nr:hypothetical protein LAZ67_8000083 [Cordylochernes scorpioides]
MAEVPKYMLGKPIKTLTHPVDSGGACSFVLSVFLVAIAIVTGFPIVVFFGLFLPVAFLVRRAGAWCSSHQDCAMVAPTEAFWLHDTTFNFHVAHCLFFFQGDLAVAKLRELVMARLIQRTSSSGRIAFPRFTQKIVRLFSGFGWVEDKSFDITRHVFQETEPIANKKQLEFRMESLMLEPLDFQKPLWEIRVVPEYGPMKETVLIFRIHQSLCDGISLVRILSTCLSDSQFVPRLKPRFGGATFPMNVFRALIVGPITFLAWFLFWRKDYNYLSRGQKPAGHYRVTWSRSIGMDKVNRIKQVTRSTLNDVLMTALTGSLRTYFCKSGIHSPPDLTKEQYCENLDGDSFKEFQ